MKYLFLLIILIIVYSCAFDNDKKSTPPDEEKTTSWLTVSEWRATTFNEYWYPTSDNPFKTTMPVKCTTVVSQYRDKFFAFDIFGRDERTLGAFDSISFTYTSNIDLGITAAIRWHDSLGDDDHLFELSNDDHYLPKTEEVKRLTFKYPDFGGDIGDSANVVGQTDVTIDQCNNFGIWSKNAINKNDTILVELVDIQIYR